MILPSYRRRKDRIDEMYKLGNDHDYFLELAKEYYELISRCTTEPEKMANQIHLLSEKVTALNEQLERARKDTEGEKRLVAHTEEMYDNLLAMNEKSRANLNSKIKALETKPLINIIKDRFNKWLFGAKG